MTSIVQHYPPILLSLAVLVLAGYGNGKLVRQARQKIAEMRQANEAERRQQRQSYWLEVAPEIEKEAA